MNLKEQCYVCKLAEIGSLYIAAQELYISQPALSLYISNLEKSLGVKLFERTGKKFILTYAGELYVERAKKMLALKESFEIELSGFKRGNKERLRIGMQSIRSSNISPILIKYFIENFPDLDLIWSEGNHAQLEERLINNQIDLFFCNCPYFKKDFNYIPIFNDNLLFLVNKDNPLIKDVNYSEDMEYPWIDLKIFENEKFILTHEGQSLRSFVNQVFDECDIKPQHILLLSKLSTITELINQGLGVGFNFKSYLQYMKNIENIVFFSVGKTLKNTTFAAVYHKTKALSKYEQTAIELLKGMDFFI